VHYEAESPERSLSAHQAGIETDMAFGCTQGRQRLVEVGQTVDIANRAQPSMSRSENCRPSRPMPNSMPDRRAGQAAAASSAERSARKRWTTDAQLDQAKATADEARARLNRRHARLTHQQLPVYATLVADTPRRRHRDVDDAGQVVASGQTRSVVALSPKRSLVAIPETLVGRARMGGDCDCVVRPEQEHAAKRAGSRPSADPGTRTYLANFHCCRRKRLARHDRDAAWPIRQCALHGCRCRRLYSRGDPRSISSMPGATWR